MHNDVSASSTDLVRKGHGVECESRVSLRGVYCSIRVRMTYQYTSEGECGKWWWDWSSRVSMCVLFTIIC